MIAATERENWVAGGKCERWTNEFAEERSKTRVDT